MRIEIEGRTTDQSVLYAISEHSEIEILNSQGEIQLFATEKLIRDIFKEVKRQRKRLGAMLIIYK